MPKKSKKARSTKLKENKERMRKRTQEKNNNFRDGQCNNQSNIKEQSNISQNCHDLDQSVISQNCHDLDQSVISQNCHDLDQSVISQNCHDLDQSVIFQNCHDLVQSVISQNCHDLDQSIISQNCHDLDQSVISQNCHDLDQSVISQNCNDLDQSVISQNCHDLDQSIISQNCHDLDEDESIISIECQYTVEKDEIILENEIENILENEIENILENKIENILENEIETLAFSKLKDLTYWDQKYLDKVLIYGNDLYSRVSGNNHHLLISDLPPILDISGKLMQLSLKESISAVIDTSETIDFSEFGNSLPLDQALQESLVDYDACFICAYDTSFLALKHGQDLFLFDSHARNEFGLKHSNGKSLLLKLSSLDHLYQYCCNMVSGASQNQWFEVTGVSISIVGEPVMYNNEVPENHEQMNNTDYNDIENHAPIDTSDYELPEIVVVKNEKSPELFQKNKSNV
ncbi:Hypothetical predicted protein [Mytilus galloprovincialis]|uniref:Uncharacterized protein n=1 Tax=Mytilus galloprovincialis TaxID=29158 RepID=A0A8B6DQU0_MYTGA|nr:Hypothetical predicted protein [Mytilus galloprovincialis]